MSDLTCPKCQGPMRSYERNGVTVDQCTDCRGVFLDRGELERLVDAEGDYYGGDKPREPSYQQRGHEERGYEHRGYEHHGKRHKKHRREGFLGELFDFD